MALVQNETVFLGYYFTLNLPVFQKVITHGRVRTRERICTEY